MDYREFKNLITSVLRVKPLTESDDADIIISPSNSYVMGPHTGFVDITIKNEEIVDLFNEYGYLLVQNDSTELITNNTYETIIDTPITPRNHDALKAVNQANGLSFSIGVPSLQYAIYYHYQYSLIASSRRQPLYGIGRIRESENQDLKSILTLLVPYPVLRIESSKKNPISLEEYRILSNSYFFNIMYTNDIPVHPILSFENFMPARASSRRRGDVNTPSKKYVSDIFDYYRLAMSSKGDPFLQFISFYHIVEFFFDDIYRKLIINEVRNIITNPGFSYKDDQAILHLVDTITDRKNSLVRAGQGNEGESLVFVLKEFIKREALIGRVDELQANSIDYYIKNEASFANAPKLITSDEPAFYATLAKRIYLIRNALVHSKSGTNAARYRPYSDEQDLLKEIPLIRAVAEQIMINSSKVL